MKAKLESLSARTLLVIAGVIVLVYAGAAWMLMVSPKRSEAATAKADLAAAEVRLVEAQASARRPRGAATPVADVFRLARAMPSSADQPGLVLEISQLAEKAGVTLRSITPQDEVAEAGGPASIPTTVIVSGRYGQIAGFLARMRRLVIVSDGKIETRGRLLTVESVSLVESGSEGFPKLDATIGLDAYVYNGPLLPPDVPPPAVDDTSVEGSAAIGRTD